MNTTPVSLLERLRRPGDADAWPRFVELYSPLLFAWARREGLAEADAADLVQDVFALLVCKLPEFVHDGRRSFRAWLKTVALNKLRENCRRAPPPGQAPDGVLDEVAGPASEAFWEAEYREHLAARALAVMRAEFQPATWKAFWELVVAGRPGADVARELGLSVNAVYIARSRVLRRLRQELEGLLE
jgi:RNA polymerase sigma-70 factor (ECF subfamily)